jgi:hypothetical protein
MTSDEALHLIRQSLDKTLAMEEMVIMQGRWFTEEEQEELDQERAYRNKLWPLTAGED